MASKRAPKAKAPPKAKLLLSNTEKPVITVESVLLSLNKEADPKQTLVTPEQARMVSRLQVGTTTLVTVDTKEFLYELIWMLNKASFDVVYTHLNQDWQLIFSDETTDVKEIRKGILFTSPLLNKARQKAIIDLETFRQKVEAREGLYECRCGSKNTRSFERQIRSADEPAAIFVVCQDCLRTWREQ